MDVHARTWFGNGWVNDAYVCVCTTRTFVTSNEWDGRCIHTYAYMRTHFSLRTELPSILAATWTPACSISRSRSSVRYPGSIVCVWEGRYEHSANHSFIDGFNQPLNTSTPTTQRTDDGRREGVGARQLDLSLAVRVHDADEAADHLARQPPERCGFVGWAWRWKDACIRTREGD